MARALVFLMLVAGGVAEAQPRTPAFLDDRSSPARLETRHLEAAIDGPVRLSPDGRVVVTVLVTPKPKMHVYAADVAGYVPFTLEVERQPGVKAGRVTYPQAETYVFPPTGESSRVYIAPFRVTQTLTIGQPMRTAIAAGQDARGVVTIRYQACDDTVCYRPTSGTLTFDFVK